MVTKEKSMVEMIDELLETADKLIMAADILTQMKDLERPKSKLEKILERLEQLEKIAPLTYDNIWISPNITVPETAPITTWTDSTTAWTNTTASDGPHYL